MAYCYFVGLAKYTMLNISKNKFTIILINKFNEYSVHYSVVLKLYATSINISFYSFVILL